MESVSSAVIDAPDHDEDQDWNEEQSDNLAKLSQEAVKLHPQDHEAAKREYVRLLLENRSALALENLVALCWDSARNRIAEERKVRRDALGKLPRPINVSVSTKESILSLGEVCDTSHFLDNWSTKFGHSLSDCTGKEVRQLQAEAASYADGWHRREMLMMHLAKRTPPEKRVRDCIKPDDRKAKELFEEAIRDSKLNKAG